MILEGMYAYGWTNAAISNAPSRLRDALHRYCPTMLSSCLSDISDYNHPSFVKPYSKLNPPSASCAAPGASSTSVRHHNLILNECQLGSVPASATHISNIISSGNPGAVSAMMIGGQDVSLSGMDLATILDQRSNFENPARCQDVPHCPVIISNPSWASSPSLLDCPRDSSNLVLDLDQTHWDNLD